MPDTFSSPRMPLVPFKLLPWCWNLERMSLSKSLCPLRRTAWEFSSFFHQLNSCWFLQPEVMGTYLPGNGILGCGAGTAHSQDILSKFSSTTGECGTSPFRICALPSSLGGCGFFSSIVVGLPFSSISDGLSDGSSIF